VTASAIVASGFIAADEVSAASHKVQSGDTLWSIAQKYNTSVAQLKSLNKLSGDAIFLNQVLEVGVSSTKTEPTNKKSSTSSSSSSSSNGIHTYTVKAGDTLSRIAQQHNVSINDLIKLNNLNSTLIYPGNVLVVSKNGSTSPTQSSQASKNDHVENNKSSNAENNSS